MSNGINLGGNSAPAKGFNLQAARAKFPTSGTARFYGPSGFVNWRQALACKGGRVIGFQEGVQLAIPALRRYARALTHDADLADDLVQDTLVRALRSQHLFNG